jgi:hypothetical protein
VGLSALAAEWFSEALLPNLSAMMDEAGSDVHMDMAAHYAIPPNRGRAIVPPAVPSSKYYLAEAQSNHQTECGDLSNALIPPSLTAADVG